MIHRDEGLVLPPHAVAEGRVRHQRALGLDPIAARGGDRGLYHVLLGIAEESPLACMRIEPQHADPRMGNLRAAHGTGHETDRLPHALRSQTGAHGRERHMDGDEPDRQAGTPEEHPHLLRPRQPGQHLGMAREGNRGGLPGRLADGCGDDGPGQAAANIPHGGGNPFSRQAAACRLRLPRLHRLGDRGIEQHGRRSRRQDLGFGGGNNDEARGPRYAGGT